MLLHAPSYCLAHTKLWIGTERPCRARSLSCNLPFSRTHIHTHTCTHSNREFGDLDLIEIATAPRPPQRPPPPTQTPAGFVCFACSRALLGAFVRSLLFQLQTQILSLVRIGIAPPAPFTPSSVSHTLSFSVLLFLSPALPLTHNGVCVHAGGKEPTISESVLDFFNLPGLDNVTLSPRCSK